VSVFEVATWVWVAVLVLAALTVVAVVGALVWVLWRLVAAAT
jgi:hypothetical protein